MRSTTNFWNGSESSKSGGMLRVRRASSSATRRACSAACAWSWSGVGAAGCVARTLAISEALSGWRRRWFYPSHPALMSSTGIAVPSTVIEVTSGGGGIGGVELTGGAPGSGVTVWCPLTSGPVPSGCSCTSPNPYPHHLTTPQPSSNRGIVESRGAIRRCNTKTQDDLKPRHLAGRLAYLRC